MGWVRSLRLCVQLVPLVFVVFVQWVKCVSDLLTYWRGLLFFVRGGSYANCPVVRKDLHAKVHLYAMTLIFRLWNEPHYRSGTYQEDLRDNLRNVAVPGTGMPLSFWVQTKILAYFFCFIINPCICAVIAVGRCGLQWSMWRQFSAEFRQLLLHPTDWFTLWRMNCSLASFHSGLLHVPGYQMENKWQFLKQAELKGFPVSPWKTCRALSISKSKVSSSFYQRSNQYHGVTDGGDWIIQEKLDNSAFLQEFLPPDAPLSTFRVVTGWEMLDTDEEEIREVDSLDHIHAFSCVLRAGLNKAPTDHVSILFDVDMDTGEILRGTTNNHWYRVGMTHVGSGPFSSTHNITRHPDSDLQVTGRHVKEIEEMLQMARQAHSQLLSHVPMAGWDLALTKDGIKLLEVNLSCNFFRGSLNLPAYFAFVDKYFHQLSVRYQIACAIDSN